MTTIKAFYMKHYEQGIRSLLTEYADANAVTIRNGSFTAILNPALTSRTIENILYRLEYVYHSFSISVKR